MSKVIKAAMWQQKPCVVEAPAPQAYEEAAVESLQLDEETQANLIATIREKEQRASELLKKTEISCEIMKQEAQKQQNDMLDAARLDADKIKEEARSSGHDEGFALGRQEGEAQIRQEQQQILTDAQNQASDILNTARQESRQYVSQAENEIAEMAMDIVNKILPQHFIDVPQVILPLVRQAILKVKDQSDVVVHVAPGAYDLVDMARMEFQSLLEGNARLSVVSDESLSEGDCLLETPNGTVDAKLSTKLEAVSKAIQEVMSR